MEGNSSPCQPGARMTSTDELGGPQVDNLGKVRLEIEADWLKLFGPGSCTEYEVQIYLFLELTLTSTAIYNIYLRRIFLLLF